MRQFQIGWASLPYRYPNMFIVAEITTTIRAIPVEVRVGRREGLPEPCVANLDNIRTVARMRLDSRAGALPPSRQIGKSSACWGMR
ncbi:MAG: type II toxin-antitoxin system PemK/MazF family toxin, partial [Bryobacteraceae bacterium]